MPPKVQKLTESLMAATDGGVACDAINALAKHAAKGDESAKQALADYMLSGQVEHMRDFAGAMLAEEVDESDASLAPQFKAGLTDEAIRLWCILGYANTSGRESYEALTRIAQDESLPVEDRAQAVKCLATSSGQPFDRQLPSDPGEWEETDLRIDEVAAWSHADYPDGGGHTLPTRDPALDKPRTKLEKAAGQLDKRLAKERARQQDPAAPTNWLAVASDTDLDAVTARWDLPSVYLDFLTRFSPIQVLVKKKQFWNGGLQLFGAAELIEAQDGYAFDPVKKRPLRDWPADYVVIASHGGDPFVLDLSSSNGEDAPVLTAEHGTGEWDFEPFAESFEKFLKTLAK